MTARLHAPVHGNPHRLRSGLFALLAGCAGATQASTMLPPPGPPVLELTPLVAGAPVTLRVRNAPAGQGVYFAYNRNGLGDGECLPQLQGDCLGLVGQVSVLPLSATASAIGEAVVTVTLPPTTEGMYLGIQAAVGANSLQLTNTVAARVAPVGSSRDVDADVDGDGFTPADGDCNDHNPLVRPGAVDALGDGYDLDCSGRDGTDVDGDGEQAVASGGTDCDDHNPARYSQAAETCDGVDNDCDGVIDAGGAPCDVVDLFTVGAARPADLLFVVDNSGAMLDHQYRVSTVVGDVFDALDMARIDYHAGVVTMDTAGANAGVLRSAFGYSWFDGDVGSPADAALWYGMTGLPGDTGSAVERGLRAAALSFSPTLLSGPNAGFYRSAADLHVIFISNAEDESGNQPTVSDFIGTLQQQKARPFQAVAHGVIGPASGCAVADPGLRYQAAVHGTGGLFESICEPDLSGFAEDLADFIVASSGGGRGAFELSSVPPDPSTIDVVAIPQAAGIYPLSPADWVYDPVRNTIEVTAPLPTWTTLVVSYGF